MDIYNELYTECEDSNNDENNTANEIENIINNDEKNKNIKKNRNYFLDKENYMPWVEKYRPRKIKDVLEQTQIIKLFNHTIKTGELTHLILYGPPGTGKTSIILALVRQLFGEYRLDERVLELNASDDRGINIVRNKIISFSKLSLGTPDINYPSPPFKIVILDEADAMTSEAQAAMRKVMEQNTNITIFCFICNYINKIIEPIKSRCVKFRFKPVDINLSFYKLKYISQCEKIKLNDNCLMKIAEISEGDMRNAITTLQNTKYIKSKNNKITVNDILNATGCVSENTMEKIWKICISCSIAEVECLSNKICRKGYQINNIFNFIKTKIINSTFLTDKNKSILIIELCKINTRLFKSSDEYLQLLNILVLVNSVHKKQ
jgi:replication factor C subunit 2/4